MKIVPTKKWNLPIICTRRVFFQGGMVIPSILGGTSSRSHKHGVLLQKMYELYFPESLQIYQMDYFWRPDLFKCMAFLIFLSRHAWCLGFQQMCKRKTALRVGILFNSTYIGDIGDNIGGIGDHQNAVFPTHWSEQIHILNKAHLLFLIIHHI